MENNELKDLFGSTTQAIGTTLSAIGSTPLLTLHNRLFSPANLNLWGHAMQAAGNSLQADSEETITLAKIGNIVQAIGNSTVLTGILADEEGEIGPDLIIKGDLLQALGSGAVFADAIGKAPIAEVHFTLYGNLLQSIGNAMQALGGMINRRGGEGQNIITAGSWIQAIGSIIAAIGIAKKYTH